MLVHGCRVRVQTIKRNQASNRGKQRQQKIKRDSGRNREKAIFGNAVVNAQRDILPALGWNLRRAVGAAATIVFPVC
jgi:hypothetical protein